MHTANVLVAWVLTAQDRLQEGLREVELDARELAALTLVDSHGGRSADWLRVRVELSQSGTVRLVDRLEGRGLLRRGSSTGRGVPLHVTAAGEQRLRHWHQVRDAVVQELLAGLPEEQRQILLETLTAALLAQHRDRPAADTVCRTCTWTACGQDCPVDRSVSSAAPGQ